MTFLKGSGDQMSTYDVEYDVVISAMKPEAGGVETVASADGMKALGRILGNIRMRPQGARRDGTKAPVLESAEDHNGDGAIRIFGAASADGIGVRNQEAQSEWARRQSVGYVPLSADSPDGRVLEVAGHAADAANRPREGTE